MACNQDKYCFLPFSVLCVSGVQLLREKCSILFEISVSFKSVVGNTISSEFYLIQQLSKWYVLLKIDNKRQETINIIKYCLLYRCESLVTELFHIKTMLDINKTNIQTKLGPYPVPIPGWLVFCV